MRDHAISSWQLAQSVPNRPRWRTSGWQSLHARGVPVNWPLAWHARQRPAVHAACRTCHGDPHRGSNAFDCSDCHRADRWRIIRFDHDLTSYPLVGRHRIAACGGCHTNPTWTGVRSDCVACHALDRPRTQDHLTKLTCDDCHTPTSWRTVHSATRR